MKWFCLILLLFLTGCTLTVEIKPLAKAQPLRAAATTNGMDSETRVIAKQIKQILEHARHNGPRGTPVGGAYYGRPEAEK